MISRKLALVAAAVVAIVAAQGHAAIVAGQSIGIDFGTDGGSATNWNPLASPGDDKAAGTLTDTSGATVTGVAFSTNVPGGVGTNGANTDSAISSSYPQIPNAAQDDWWFETGTGGWSLVFGGLDDALTYDLIIGAYAPGGTAAQQLNRNSRWTVDGQTLDTDADSLAGSYLTFTGLETDGSGNLVIASLAIGSNETSVVSALRLTAVATVPAPAALPVGLAMLGLGVIRRRH